MKKYLLLAAALFVGTICFTSCSDDDEDVDVDQLLSDLEHGKIKPTASFEDGNPMTLTLKYNKVATSKDMATFDEDGRCLSFKTIYEFVSKEIADRLWEKMVGTKAKIEPVYTRLNDKTIVQDLTSLFKGDDYKDVKEALAEKMLDETVDSEEIEMIEEYKGGQKLPETDLTEKDNTMTLTINYKDFLSVTCKATFGSDGLCQSLTRTFTFVNKNVADFYWLYISSGIHGLGPVSTRNGNSIVQNLTDEYGHRGEPKGSIQNYFEDMQADADNGDFLDYYMDLDNYVSQW